MRSPRPMAIPMSEWREQQIRTDKVHRALKLGIAAVCIVGAASYWQDIAKSISAMVPAAEKATTSAPVPTHRQSQGPSVNAPALTPALSPAVTPAPLESKTTLERLNDASREAVMGAANGVKVVVKAVGFHKDSDVYKAKPELEQALLEDHGAQKQVAKMIADTYKVPFKTATMIVAKSVVEAKKHAVDPLLVLALMGQESSYNKDAESDYGAQGIMQVVPRYHEDKMKKLKVEDILKASLGKQIELGMVVFKDFLGRDNQKPIELALQHYNQGEHAKIDPTLKYANKILDKREALAATVEHYVQVNAAVDNSTASIKPNL